MAGSNDDLFRVVQAWVQANYPGAIAVEVAIRLNTTGRVRLPVPVGATAPATEPTPAASPRRDPAGGSPRRGNGHGPALPEGVFEPNDLQADILEALEWKYLNADNLAAAVGVSRRALYRKPGGIGELIEKEMVQADRQRGYFRPDMPPDPEATEGG